MHVYITYVLRYCLSLLMQYARSCDTIRDRSYAACDTRYAVKLSLRHHTQHAIGDEVIGIGGENYRHVITRGMRHAACDTHTRYAMKLSLHHHTQHAIRGDVLEG